MTSVLRHIAQIDPTTKYLIALTTTTVYTINSGATLTSTMTDAAFTAATGTTTQVANTVFRDLGKFVMTYTASGQKQHTALYRLVQPQLGYTTEGVPGNYATQRYYVRVWAADDTVLPITVARVG